jgi:hypothetical protein
LISPESKQELKELLLQLELKLTDLQERLPAHSVNPNLIVEMDDLDDQIKEVKSRLALIQEDGDALP